MLRAVVEEYVRTGEPVGSETIAERSNLNVSSATIRNELAALEEAATCNTPTRARAGSRPTSATAGTSTRCLPAASSGTPSAVP